MAYKTHEEILREELERAKANGSVAALPQQTEPTVIAPAPSAEVVAESERLHAQDAGMPQHTQQAVAGFGVPPKQSDYDWNTKFAEQYFGPVMTEEERARRERAAYISSGVANLGKAFGALGNMFYAAHGAPAQEAVKVADVDPKIAAFRQRADKVRDAYLNAHRLDKSDFNEAYSRYLSGEKYKAYAEKEKRLRDAQELQKMKFEWLQKYQERMLELKAEQQAIDKAYKEKRITVEEYNAATRSILAKIADYNSKMRWGDTTQEVDESYELDSFGNKTGVSRTTTTSHSPSGAGSRSNSGGGNSSQSGGGGNKGTGYGKKGKGYGD